MKQVRRNHSSTFKARVALEAMKGDQKPPDHTATLVVTKTPRTR